VGEVPDPLARHVDVPAVVGVVPHALLRACDPPGRRGQLSSCHLAMQSGVLHQYARVRVMGCYSESEKALGRDRKAFQRRRCASAIRARPAFVLGPVDIPPWNRQRRFPGTTLMHDARAAGTCDHRLNPNSCTKVPRDALPELCMTP
jgi:hypothetical protein